MRLRRSADSVFADDVLLESTLGPLAFDTDAVYEGQLRGIDTRTIDSDSRYGNAIVSMCVCVCVLQTTTGRR